MIFSAFTLTGCNTSQLESPRNFHIGEGRLLANFTWERDVRATDCGVFVWRDDQNEFVHAASYLRPPRVPGAEVDPPPPVMIGDLNLEIGENKIKIISRAPQNSRLLDSEPVQLILLMDEQGNVTIK